jgi:hypothetical protein
MQEAYIGGCQSKVSLGRNTSPYLKNNESKKGLGAWLRR